MGYDVTIGIPVYKSVDFICRALESALAQSYLSIEFLIVDDAGHDGSVEMIQSIKETHPRGNAIHIIHHQDNLGVSASRNQIIDAAQGEFLYFMDSDDVISENTIELMMKNIRQYDAEIVFGSYEKIELSGSKTIYQYPSIQLLHEDELACFAYRKYAGIQASACNYLVKLSVLRANNHCFVDANYWEDLVFTFDLVTIVSRAVLLPDITYFYICRKNSLSHYQQRNIIPKEEIMQNVKAIHHLKQTSSRLVGKIFFPKRCVMIVITDFYIACNIIKRRRDIMPFVTDGEIKNFMIHPASLRQICRFRNNLILNLCIYLLSKLPAFLCVALITFIGKQKKLI